MPLVDLSHPLRTGMPVYPGDPEVSIEPALEIDADGVAVARLELGSHAGTHLDAPSHSVPGGRTVDRIDLELLCGPARVLRVLAPTAGGEIRESDLAAALPERLPPRVLVATGWGDRFGSELALRHPSISADLAERLWAAGARVLGVDALSPDSTASALAGGGLPVHEFWLGRDGLIIENLRGLDEVPDEIELLALPLALDGVDGSPIRAAARF